MRRVFFSVLAALLMVATASCDRKSSVAPMASKPTGASLLAYTYSVTVRLDADAIGKQLTALRDACSSGTMGDCNLMAVTQKDAFANITVRIAPEGVQRMITLASHGGALVENEVRAEDLSVDVAKTQRDSETLEQYARRLEDVSARRDLPAADLIALGHEQAEVAVKRQALADTTASQRRRLDTNLLSIDLVDASRASRGGEASGSWRAILDRSVEGLFDAAGFLAYGLPFLVLTFPLALLWRWCWRKATRRKAER